MIKVLFVEDNRDSIRLITDFVEDNKSEWNSETVDFINSYERIITYDPDLIVLDLKDDADNVYAGTEIFNAIRSRYFSPIIIFSAQTATLPDEILDLKDDNPLFEIAEKGDEQFVIDTMVKWEPYLAAVTATRSIFSQSFSMSAKALAYYFSIEEFDEKVVQYMLCRRMQASFSNDCVGINPPAWIAYEYPPANNDILVSDILRVIEGDMNSVGEANKYCVVLTPSCDMATRNKVKDKPDEEKGGEGKAEKNKKILIAYCESAGALFNEKCSCAPNKGNKDKKKHHANTYINTGYNNAMVPLPELPHVLPYMTVNLKNMDFINLSDVATDEKDIENKKYLRIASMNSPFRESTVWAHLINSCRPGVQERNRDPWIEAVVDDWFASASPAP